MLVVAVVVAALLAPAVAVARPLHHPRLTQVRPRAFASCADLVGYAGRHFAVTHGIPARGVATLVQPTPMPFPAEGAPQGSAPAAPVAAEPTAGTTFSTTNNQEEGVDEPDIVKTDGTTIFAVAQGKLFAVDAGGPEPRLVGSLDLGPTGWGAQLLLRGSRLIVISGGGPVPVAIGAPTGPGPQPAAAAAIAPYPIAAKTVVTEVDVHDPAAMKVARTMTIDGTYVDARQNGSTARVVISSTPRYARLSVDGVTSLAGWRAGEGGRDSKPSIAIDADGRIPIDIRSRRGLGIASPEGRQWNPLLPENAPDGYEIHIRLDGPGYDGVLTSMRTGKRSRRSAR